MRWTERQRAMLAEMGLRPWFRDDGDTATADGPTVEEVDAHSDVAAATAAPSASTTTTAAATPASNAATTTPTLSPPTRASVVAPTSAHQAAQASSEAAWLIVAGPSESADDASRAAAEAEQELLLVNMLRSIGVSSEAAVPATRSLHVRTGTPVMDELDRLHAQQRPRCVIVLGRAAAMTLLGIDEPLGRLRGRVHAWRGVPVVVTFPLAYLLRNPGEKAKAWLDLCLAATAIDTQPQ